MKRLVTPQELGMWRLCSAGSSVWPWLWGAVGSCRVLPAARPGTATGPGVCPPSTAAPAPGTLWGHPSSDRVESAPPPLQGCRLGAGSWVPAESSAWWQQAVRAGNLGLCLGRVPRPHLPSCPRTRRFLMGATACGRPRGRRCFRRSILQRPPPGQSNSKPLASKALQIGGYNFRHFVKQNI